MCVIHKYSNYTEADVAIIAELNKKKTRKFIYFK